MMKRIFMLLALALMVVAAIALSGVAQAGTSTSTLASPKPITYVCVNKSSGQLFYLASCTKSQTSTSVTSSSTQFKACYQTSNGLTRKVPESTKCSNKSTNKEITIEKVPADSSSLYFCVKSSDGTMFFKPGTTEPTCPTGQYAVVIGPHNQAPSAVGDTYSTDEDTTLNVSAPGGVLSNDSDPDGDTITAQLGGTGPSHGTLTLNLDGSFSYTPASNYDGPDAFTYKASDGKGGEATATVSITVNAVNDAPVANNDSTTVDAGGTIGANVLTNDSDVDGDSLNAGLVSGPSHGTLTLNLDGSFSYTPNADYNGADSFTYKASDGTADSNVATAKITVNPTGADAQCMTLAIQTLGSSFNPSNYTFHGGTADGDAFTGTDGQSEVFCGFGGNDAIGILQAGDIFIGGDGNDALNTNNGTFYGDAGDDRVGAEVRDYDNNGTFYGGDGNDQVANRNDGTFNGGADTDYVEYTQGTFNGGDGNDQARENAGTFNGDAGDDSVRFGNSATFNGGAGNDYVISIYGNSGTFNGGDGNDSVTTNFFFRAIFNGGDGNDSVTTNTDRATFNGGTGDDSVTTNEATFNGGDDTDSVTDNFAFFNGDAGDDSVTTNYANATFNGGDGNDSVGTNNGTFVQ